MVLNIIGFMDQSMCQAVSWLGGRPVAVGSVTELLASINEQVTGHNPRREYAESRTRADHAEDGAG
jgi:hypothetical protein